MRTHIWDDAPMARRRRRWGVRFGLLAVIILILSWQGWGLLSSDGGDGEPGDGSETARLSDAPPPPDPASEREPDADKESDAPPEVGGDEDRGPRGGLAGRGAGAGGDPDGGSTETGDAGTGAAVAGDTEATQARTGDPQAGETKLGTVDAEVADRLFALQELIRESVATDRLGDGFRALEDLEEITRAEGPPTLRAEGRQVLGNALTATVLQLREHLNAGRVLEARRLLSALRGTHHARVLQALDTMASGEGWPALGQGPEAALQVPEPRLLSRERHVLVDLDEQLVAGRVAECRLDKVTVRLQREDGVVFPEVARVLIQPVDATGEEAVQQGFVALRAGDRDLAWLWLCRAHAAGGSGELVRQLGRLIGG